MRHLRLCVIGNLLGRNPGYVTTQGLLLGNQLLKEGHKVEMASSKINRLLRMIDIVNTVIRGRDTTDVLIMEVYSGLNFWVADVIGRVTRAFGIPSIFVLHGGNLPRFADRRRSWVTRALTRADKLIAPSSYMARELKNLALPIEVIPNLIDLSEYPFELRRHIKPSLLWMRAFHGVYNPKMALNVFGSIRDKYPDASLVMAGVDKGLEQNIKDMAKEMGLLGSVRFPGFLDQEAKIREFSNADIFINTNRIDNMPVAVLEACAMGLPVVATCVGGIPDLIRNGHNGLLVPDRDVEGMVSAVESLLENPELAGLISINGRKLAEESSWEKVRCQWEELFQELQRRKEKPTLTELPVESFTNS